MTHSVLLYMPLTDPTSGYHSLAYLNGAAASSGHGISDVIDVNIEAFLGTLDDPQANALLNSGQVVRQRFLSGAEVPYADSQEAKRAILRALPITPDSVRQAVELLRDADDFYDYQQYRQAVRRVNSWMNQASLTGVPGAFDSGFRRNLRHAVNAYRISDLRNGDFLDRLTRPFAPYLEQDLLPRLSPYEIIGINVTYESQLPFALDLMRRIRNGGSKATIVIGGTEVADVWKYLEKKGRFFDLFQEVDLAVLGEGESAWVEILSASSERREPDHPNVLANHAGAPVRRPLPLYEQVAQVPRPIYDGLPFDKYLAPAKFLYYSPTRGCYWNKCTFCDYGLNFESPTSPWRHDPIDRVVEDLRVLSASTDTSSTFQSTYSPHQ